MDRLPNKVIIIGTTNRFELLDKALIRRFPLQFELLPLTSEETNLLANKFFSYVGVDCGAWLNDWCCKTFGEKTPASSVIRECTDVIVNHILEENSDG